MDYPVSEGVNSGRQIEHAVVEHFLDVRGIVHTKLLSGDDSLGVPDVFVFDGNDLVACIEVGAYVLGDIQDHQPACWNDGTLVIDIEKSTAIHEPQPQPYTIVHKKLAGGRQYIRYPGVRLILIIHSDVRLDGDRLRFAMDGPLQMSPSCNHFSHYRDEICSGLITAAQANTPSQWDEVVLIDYTVSLDSYACPVHQIHPAPPG